MLVFRWYKEQNLAIGIKKKEFRILELHKEQPQQTSPQSHSKKAAHFLQVQSQTNILKNLKIFAFSICHKYWYNH